MGIILMSGKRTHKEVKHRVLVETISDIKVGFV